MRTPKERDFKRVLRPGGLKTCLHLVRVSLVLIFAASITFAQSSGSATLRGTIKDPQGALISKAMVTLTNDATKLERTTTTNDEGLYQFTAVTPGTYTVKVEKSGFKSIEQKEIALSTSDTRGQDFEMEVGAQNETVTVQASAEVIQKETGANENTITA